MSALSPENEPSAQSQAGNATLLASRIVASYVGNHSVTITELPALIRSVFVALSEASAPPMVAAPAKEHVPAVSVKKSVTPDYIVCLEDGKKMKMLKRHLRSVYNLTPDEYRTKWGLPPDYPMTAPNYAAERSKFARKIGLGKKAAAVDGQTSGPTGRSKKSGT